MIENVLIGVILWVVGLFFGFVIRGAFFKSTEMELKVRKKLKETQQQFALYQSSMRAELSKTSGFLLEIHRSCASANAQVLLLMQGADRDAIAIAAQNPAPPKDYPSHP